MINEHDIKDMKVYPQPADPAFDMFNLYKKPAEKQGTKHDQNKLRMDLIDAKAMEGLAAVLTFGAQKYAAHNWRNGISYSRVLAALLRHISAIQRGEYIDPESGLPHIDHVGCCWMFLSNFMKTRPDLDDLWKPNEVQKSNIG